MKHIVITSVLMVLLFCSCNRGKTDVIQSPRVTAEMARQGVNNYCHSHYDWSKAEADSATMYVTMGEEAETEYQVIFRSYTGALVNFFVDKASGKTRMVETVPALGIESEPDTIDLWDYLGKAPDGKVQQ